jgi:hypothetical protein
MAPFRFAERVRQHFHYLVDDLGFSVMEESHDPEAFGNSLVRFRRHAVDVLVVLDRGQVLVDIRPRRAGLSSSQFGLASLVRFLAPESEEPAYVFPESWDAYHEMVEWQLKRLARVLRQYCLPVLTGEFSGWEALDARRAQEAREG